jgi:hypothetical protein
METTNYGAPHYVVFFCLFSLLWSQYSPWHSVFDRPQSTAQFWLSGFELKLRYWMVTSWGVDGPGIKSWWGAKLSASVQTGPGAHSRLLCNGYRVSFLGVKQQECVINHPAISSTKVKESGAKAKPLLLLCAFMVCSRGFFYLFTRSWSSCSVLAYISVTIFRVN